MGVNVWFWLTLLAVLGALALAGRRLLRTRRRWRRLLGTLPIRPRPAVPPAWGAVVDHRLTRLVAVAIAAAVGLLLDGPAAAGVLAIYCGLLLWLVRRAAARRRHGTAQRSCVDAVAALAAELRAGVAVGPALADAQRSLSGPQVVGEPARAVGARVGAAVALAEATGAPLADVLERLDTHLRAVDRARASAGAQAAGAQASALMLATMPVAGVGLGYLIGIDPLAVLLHTPIGLACVVVAVALQLGGVAWSIRLSQVEVAI